MSMPQRLSFENRYFSSETFIQDPNGDNLGTATGSFLAAARSFGFRVRGLDLSSRFAAFARKWYDLNVDVGYVEEFAIPRSYYDVICSFDGIACWRDPIRALANIREALKPDGIFVMNHFDIDSLPGKILGHHHFEYNHASLVIFSRRTMRQCLAHAGFEQVYSQSERQYASFGRIAGYLKWKAILKALCSLSVAGLPIRSAGAPKFSIRILSWRRRCALRSIPKPRFQICTAACRRLQVSFFCGKSAFLMGDPHARFDTGGCYVLSVVWFANRVDRP
jgi:SAM-dependent methyltransferase